MPEYPLPYTSMSGTRFSSAPPAGLLPVESPMATLSTAAPAGPSKQRPPVQHRPLKGVYSMLKRLYSSYLRASAAHDARLDAALCGEQGYLLLHYFHSAK